MTLDSAGVGGQDRQQGGVYGLSYVVPVVVLAITLYVVFRILLAIPPPGAPPAPNVDVAPGPITLTFTPTIGSAVLVLAVGAVCGVLPLFVVRAWHGARVQRDRAVADATSATLEREDLQRRLVQAQKMESIGRLAGGIAHDFNNLLTVILGQTAIVLDNLPEDHEVRADLHAVYQAAERAAGLTRQLLAFSRQQVFHPTEFSLNDLVTESSRMLRRMIGEDVSLVTRHGATEGMVRADRGQVEQVLMNLVVNARDAMPDGGLLTIETADTDLDPSYAASHPTVEPGAYVKLSVTDTGTGMTADVLANVFDPFFTTKPAGKGTGLGLATVFGIVKQSRGHVTVYSEPGHGTTFSVYLPHVLSPGTAAAHPGVPVIARGAETVLVVEDDQSVLAFTRRALESQGYVVLTAANGDDALCLVSEHDAPIHLLLTDVVLPGLSGPELARRIQAERPDIRVLFASGYTGEAVIQRSALESGVPFIQKPFTLHTLADKVRSVVDARE